MRLNSRLATGLLTLAILAHAQGPVRAQEVSFWRVRSPNTTTVFQLSGDGRLSWTNAKSGSMEVVQRTTLADPLRWQDYVMIAATSAAQTVHVVDFNAPAGMTLIPGGSFVMGDAFTNDGDADELPQHLVYVSAFYMDMYEVTKALWDEVLADTGGSGYEYMNSGLSKATNHPAHTETWHDAVKWCNARSERDGLTPVYYTDTGFTTLYKTGDIHPYANWSANGYRLPTEAEWEKAARAGASDTRFPWTDFTNQISWAKANYSAANNVIGYDLDAGFHPTFYGGGSIPYPYTSPVGYFPPNDYGLYDMAGNVMEWCWDWYSDTYYAVSPGTDPKGPAGPLSDRVQRGGAWSYSAQFARVADRYSWIPNGGYDLVGFRCVRRP